MCKIIMKFGADLTVTNMENHREPCETGAGILTFNGFHFRQFKAMKHEDLFNQWKRLKVKSPFFLFHSRMPSHGEVIMDNVQPFASNSSHIAFCHNGTVGKRDLMLTAGIMGDRLNGLESDSNLLFRVLKRCEWITAKAILEEYDQNFIAINKKEEEVFIHGRYKMIFHPSNERVGYLRNEFGERKRTLTTDLEGNIKMIYEYKEIEWSKLRTDDKGIVTAIEQSLPFGY
jgi:predicted glutamine amidotransferase